MTALPTSTTVANFDAATDDPKQARAELATNAGKVNTLIEWATGLFGSSGDKSTSMAALGAISSLSADTNPTLSAPLKTASFRILESAASAVTASAVNFGSTNYNTITLTGSTTVSSFNYLGHIGTRVTLLVDDTFTLKHSSNLILPGAANIVTEAGDMFGLTQLSSTVQRVFPYMRAAKNPGGLDATLETSASTVSTGITFSGLPTGITKIEVMFVNVSLSGSDDPILQIGDSGGLKTSGYTSAGVRISTGGPTGDGNSTTGFKIEMSSASDALYGTLVLDKFEGDVWLISGIIRTLATGLTGVGGTVTLSGDIDRVKISPSGANTFDAGSMNLKYWK